MGVGVCGFVGLCVLSALGRCSGPLCVSWCVGCVVCLNSAIYLLLLRSALGAER